MRKLILALLFAVGMQAQTTVPSLKIQNLPTVLNDTTTVDILVRQKTGSSANLGLVKRVNWSYLLSIFGGAGDTPDLQAVGNVGSTMSVPTNITLTHSSDENFSEIGLSDHSVTISVVDNQLNINPDSAGIVSNFAVGAAENPNDAIQLQQVAPTINAKQIPLPYKFKLIAKYTPNPDDSDSNSGGRYFDYETDSLRTFDLQDYITAVGGTSNAVISDITKVRNNIILSIELNDNFHQRGVLLLKDCYIINNELKVTSFQYKELTDLGYKDGVDPTHEPYSLHSTALYNDYVYYISRNQTMAGVYNSTPPQIFRLNVNNLSDYSFVTLPNSGGYLGQVGEMDVYKNRLYFIARASSSSANMCSIDADLANPAVLFPVSTTIGNRVPQLPPFVIYENEIYIPTYYASGTPANVAYNTIGIQVFDIAKKTITREVNQLPIATGITSGTLPAPHWITIFGGKIILHTGTATNNLNKKVVRIDAKTLAFEESFDLSRDYSNDNFVTAEGYVELYPENGSGNYYRFFYKDFAGTATIVDSNYYALGCPQYPVEKEKALLKLSDFENDIAAGSGTVTSVTGDTTGGINVATGTTTPAITASTASGTQRGTTKLYNNVSGTNTDGAPDQASVNTALAGINKKLFGSTTSASVDHTADGTTEKILYSFLVPAGTLSNGVISFYSQTIAAGTGSKTLRLKTNTTNTLSGATQVATHGSTAAGYRGLERTKISINGTTVTCIDASAITDGASVGNALNTFTFNPAVDNYFFFTGQVSSSGDSLNTSAFYQMFLKM